MAFRRKVQIFECPDAHLAALSRHVRFTGFLDGASRTRPKNAELHGTIKMPRWTRRGGPQAGCSRSRARWVAVPGTGRRLASGGDHGVAGRAALAGGVREAEDAGRDAADVNRRADWRVHGVAGTDRGDARVAVVAAAARARDHGVAGGAALTAGVAKPRIPAATPQTLTGALTGAFTVLPDSSDSTPPLPLPPGPWAKAALAGSMNPAARTVVPIAAEIQRAFFISLLHSRLLSCPRRPASFR